jgi:hypothetical protein
MYVVISGTSNCMMMPVACKWQPEGVVVPTDGIFTDRATAKAFAEACARQHPGKEYWLMGREATVKTTEPAVKWEGTP